MRQNLACMVAAIALVASAQASTQGTPAGGERSGTPGAVTDCIRAMGGRERVEATRHIRLVTTNADTGLDFVFDFDRPNLERKELPGKVLIAYDGTRATVRSLDPARASEPPRVEPLDKSQDFEIEIGLFIPAFLDYPASDGGAAVLNGRPCHLVRVLLPLGPRMTYWIDDLTHLVTHVRADFSVAGQPHSKERAWSDFRAVDGLVLPHLFAAAGANDKPSRTVVTSVVINPGSSER